MKDVQVLKTPDGKYVKPPIGIMPRWLHEEIRICRLKDAIDRYNAAGLKVPAEWKEELRDLRRNQKKNKRKNHAVQTDDDIRLHGGGGGESSS